ncbi:uncharacterized protein V6R79_008463 [Siganus canaliculatus]
MIKCLPKEVQGKLRSGVAVPSLQQCVEELILNSIDAKATCVGVRMDMDAFKVQVIDNGVGMDTEDLQCVGNRYYTSKCHSVDDLDNLSWYGYRGEALASVVSLATLVEISSRTRSSVKTHTKIFKEGKGMDVFEADTARPSAGTTVVVCNFFHNMPVRRKRMDAVLEGERIRRRVEAVSLMHPSVSFTLKNDCTGAMMVQLPKARNTYHRFVQIHSLGRAQKLGEISHTHEQFEVSGYIGREGHYNSSLQFLYVNERLLLKTRIHKLLNCLLRRLSSLNQKNDSPERKSAIWSPKHKRNQELHGIYIINIKCPYSEYDVCLEPAKTLIEFRDWDGVLLCVEEAVRAFLTRENLVTELSQDDLDNISPTLFCTHNMNDEQTSNTSSTMDCDVGLKLASHIVHRKRSDNGVCQEVALIKCKDHLGQEEITINDECHNIKSGISENKECSRDRSFDPTQLKSVSDSIAEEGMLAQGEAEEGTPLECEQLQLSEESEIRITDVTSPDSISCQIQADIKSVELTLPGCQNTGGLGTTSVSKRRISLSDPYVHEVLQTPHSSQTYSTVFQQQHEEKAFASKRKISLDADCRSSCQRLSKGVAAIIPSKLPRIQACPKLSLWKDSGSLEKFRGVYGKSNGLKLTSQETPVEKNTRTVAGFLKSSAFAEDEEAVTEKADTSLNPRSPPMLSTFTKLKSISAQSKGKGSLAAKLCHLRKHGVDHSKGATLLTSAASQGDPCLSGGNSKEDSNNNENHSGATVNLESGVSSSPNPEPIEREEEGTASSDWLQHYDTSVGKMVYINKTTGLSRYENLPTEETQVLCTTDVTNIAVSVISETGDDAESSELNSLYSKWKNPVFVRPPMVGVDISRGQADGLAVKIHNVLHPYRFSKAMIHSMKVIQQVDKKFLACLINTRDEEPAALAESEENLLVLVDQHAAHERVRLENLIADSYEDDPHTAGERRLCSSNILPPLEISVTEEELRLLRSCQLQLLRLGLEVKFSLAEDPLVFVGKVPLCFVEKESNELRRGRPSVIKPIVEEYLREQIELLRSTGRVRGTLPLTVLKVLASLACHGAIKFNDILTRDECHSLVASLSSCQLPFQCAHGRPSIAPLVDLLHLHKDQKVLQKPNLQKLRRMYKAWQEHGNR